MTLITPLFRVVYHL